MQIASVLGLLTLLSTQTAEAQGTEAPGDASPAQLSPEALAKLKAELREELKAELKAELSPQDPFGDTRGPAVDDSWAEEEWKWEEPVRPALNFFELGGYFRYRYQFFNNLDLDTFYANTTTKQLYGPFMSPLPPPTAACNQDVTAEGCRAKEGRSGSLGTNSMRLRLEPVLNVYEDIRIKMQIDVLDNLVLGSTPEVLPGTLSVMSEGQAAPSPGLNTLTDAFLVKRAWAEIGTPLGQLRLGRMPDHFGLGITANAGSGIGADYGDTVDRVAFATQIGQFQIMPAMDFVVSGPISQNRMNPGGQPWDRLQADDADGWSIRIMNQLSAEEQKRRLASGDYVLNYGTLQTARFQNLDAAAYYAAQDPDKAAAETNFIKRDANLYRYSYWAQFLWKGLSIEAEYAGVLGKVSKPSLAAGSTYASQDAVNFGSGAVINQHGLAVDVQYRLLDDALRLGFLFVLASGDDAPGFGRAPLYGADQGRAKAGAWDGAQAGCTQIGVDNTGERVCQGRRDRTIGNFAFDRAFRVDQLFWRQLVGGVTDAMVFRPSVTYQGSTGFGAGFAAVFSRALFAESTPSGAFANSQKLGDPSENLGLELNAKLFYAGDQGLHAWLSYALFVPFAGLNQMIEIDAQRQDSYSGATETVNHRSYGRLDASLAHSLEFLVGVSF